MRPTGGDIFFERTAVFERRFESLNEDSISKIVFALIAFQLNPIESKLLGRIAAKAQQQQHTHQIDRLLTQICARKTQICARKTQIGARKKDFWFFQLICCICLRVSLFDQWCNLELRSKTRWARRMLIARTLRTRLCNFTPPPAWCQLLHSIYTRVNPGADKQRLNQLLWWHSDVQCLPEEAVTLLLDLGIPRRRLRVLSRFISKHAYVWYKQTGLRFGKPMPGRRRVNLAWKMMKEPLHLVGHINKKTGIQNVSWPFDHWINYVFRQPWRYETEQPSKDGLVFIVSGDGYPVAGVSWTQLTIRIRNDEHLARNAAQIRVLELAYCGDSNLQDLRRVWKKNLRVCYFFEYRLRSNLRPFERSLSFERTCFSNKILIALRTLLGPAADHKYAIRRREGRTLCGKCYAGRRFTVLEEVFGTY